VDGAGAIWTALESLPMAEALRVSRWTYPLVNAGHILGIAMLVGAVLPMDVAVLRGRDPQVRMLRPWAVAGFALALVCGSLLFTVQATDYAASFWFRLKMALLAVALVNAALHLGGRGGPVTAAVSLAVWPAVLLGGRMIAYG